MCYNALCLANCVFGVQTVSWPVEGLLSAVCTVAQCSSADMMLSIVHVLAAFAGQEANNGMSVIGGGLECS